MASNHHGDQDSPISRKRSHVQIEINRPIYTEHEFQKGYKHLDKNDSNVNKIKKKIDKVEVSPRCLWRTVSKLVPIIKWLPKYKIRSDIIGDTLSGITTAIMRVPQGKFGNHYM